MGKLIFNLIFVIFLVSLVHATGIGVTPAVLEYEDALKGVMTEKEITVQNPGDKEIVCTIVVEGEASEWIELSSYEVKVKANSQEKVTVMLTPSSDAPDGVYEASFKFKVSGESNEGGIGLFPGVETKLSATITDEEIVDGEVTKILTKDEEYGTPIVFSIGFENNGNVPAQPTVMVEIKKGNGDVVDSFEKTLDSVDPGESKEYDVEWSSEGREKDVYYRADVDVLLNGEKIYEKNGIGFKILEKSEQEDKKSENKKKPANVNIILLGAYVLIILLIIFFIIRIYGKLRKK